MPQPHSEGDDGENKARPIDATAHFHEMSMDEDGTSATDSDGDSGDETPAVDPAALEAARQAFADAPYDYDAGYALMTLLGSAGIAHAMELRAVREQMHARFALSPEIWRQWILEEQRTAINASDNKYIRKLLHDALDDFLDESVLREFIIQAMSAHALDNELKVADRTYASAAALRAEFDELARRVDHNTRIVAGVYLAFIEWEQGFLMDMAVGTKAHQTQQNRIDALYRRLFAQPHAQHEKSIHHAQDNFDEHADTLITEEYTKAKTVYNSMILPYERVLERSQKTAESYREYVLYAKNSDEAAVRACTSGIIERMLIDHSLDVDVWKFAAANAEDPRAILKRAVRNVTWAANVWVRHMEAEEAVGTPHAEILQIYDNAVAATAKTIQATNDMESYMTLLLYRFDFERRFLSAQVKASAAAGNSSKRRSPKKGAVAVDVDQLVQQLMALVGELQVALVANFPFGDATMRLQRALITALATDFGQLEMARQQWNAVMTNDACRFYAEMWMERLTFEQLYDKEHSLAHTKAICTTLELGLLNGMDWPEKVLNFYERMAREHGTVQDVVDGRVALDGPLAIVAKRRATESAQYQVAAEQQQLKRTERRQQEKGKGGKDKGKVEKERPDLKKKLGEKRRREDAMDDSAKPKKVKQEGFAEAAKSDKNITQPPAKDVEMGEAATQDNAAPAEKKPATSYFKTDADKVPLTIFVSNLSPNVTESVLRETFTGCGGSIADIRMVHDTHSQREKHFAYVEFSHEGAVERALKKDREPIQAPGDDTPRNMFVSRFHFKGGAKTASTMNAAPVDKRVLFVSKLPDEVKREQLESLFAKFGTLKEVRLMHNKEKKPYAFVEFLTEDAAVQAAAMNGTDIDGHKMQVNFSRVAAPARLGLAKSLGGIQQKSAGGRTLALGLMPRSVARQTHANAPSTSAAGAHAASSGEAAPKSNADFRAMFLKK